MATYRELTGALKALCRAVRHGNAQKGSVMLDYCHALVRRAELGRTAEMPWTAFTQSDAGSVPESTLAMLAERAGVTLAEARAQLEREMADNEIMTNSRYQVMVRRGKGATYLSIKRLDQEPIRSWRDLQRIKTELVGAENEGVEIFPAESRLVDVSNQYHLWVMNDPNDQIPFGFNSGRQVIGPGDGAAGQSALDD